MRRSRCAGRFRGSRDLIRGADLFFIFILIWNYQASSSFPSIAQTGAMLLVGEIDELAMEEGPQDSARRCSAAS